LIPNDRRIYYKNEFEKIMPSTALNELVATWKNKKGDSKKRALQKQD
jgi:hypothetical protein